MSKVKMKTVVISSSEKVWYETVMDVPEEFDDNDISDAFFKLNLDENTLKETSRDFFQIDYIEEAVESK